MTDAHDSKPGSTQYRAKPVADQDHAACAGHSGTNSSGSLLGKPGAHSHSGVGAHSHAAAWGSGRANLRFAFFLNLLLSLVELLGGLWIGSFAIMAGALHDIGDAISLGVAWFLEGYANQTSDANFNFGYRRFSLLSALVAGVVIVTGNAVILFECVVRFSHFWSSSASPPPPPAPGPMLAIAVLGLVANLWAAIRMSHGQSQTERIMTWHLIEDILSWAAVLVSAVVIHFTRITWLDPLLAATLAVFVTYNIVRHLKMTVYLFLQGRPYNFNEAAFVNQVLSVDGVDQIDHLAVWSLDGEHAVLSARLHLHQVNQPSEVEKIKSRVRSFAAQQSAVATLETCLVEEKDFEAKR